MKRRITALTALTKKNTGGHFPICTKPTISDEAGHVQKLYLIWVTACVMIITQLGQHLSTGDSLALWGNLAMSANVLGLHLGLEAAGIQCAEARAAAKLPTMHNEELSGPKCEQS